jgi:hypothetical protein
MMTTFCEWGSAVQEIRHALVDEGLHAFLLVVAGKQRIASFSSWPADAWRRPAEII